MIIASSFTLFRHSLAIMRSSANRTVALNDARLAIEWIRTQPSTSLTTNEPTGIVFENIFRRGDIKFTYFLRNTSYKTNDIAMWGQNPLKLGYVQTYWTNSFTGNEKDLTLYIALSDYMHEQGASQ